MISTDVIDDVATVTIDRREIHNALNREALHALEAELAGIRSRTDVSAVIVTGAGDRAFVAGGDLKELAEPAGVREALLMPMQRVLNDLADLPIPTIAAVNGMALGGGLELALACDIRIASTSASFALPELTWSLLPAAGGISRLSRIVGPGRALELILTGRRIDASEAAAIGLVTQVVEPAGLIPAAHELAAQIATKAPLAVRVARLVASVAAEGPLSASLVAEMLGSAALHGTADRDEGRRSFMEKRPARFEGR